MGTDLVGIHLVPTKSSAASQPHPVLPIICDIIGDMLFSNSSPCIRREEASMMSEQRRCYAS